MLSIRCQSISVRTDAAEGAEGVVTAEGAHVAQLAALVHILTRLHRTGSKPGSTGALEAAVCVGARAVTADPRLRHTLVLIWKRKISHL